MKLLSKVTCAALMGLSLSAFAATPTPAASNPSSDLSTPAAKLVSKLMNGQGTITESFPAVNNLTGFVVQSNQGNSGIVYADKKGQYLFAGSIINAQGQDMTQLYTNQYVNSKIAGPAYAAAMQLSYFTSGSDNAPHKAIVIIDPNCVYCHLMYKEFKPLIDSGQIQIRWLPVAFRDPTSPGKAAALLNAGPDAAKLFDQNEQSFNDQTEEGGLTPLQPDASNAAVTKAFNEVQANTQYFSKMGFQGTPTILFKQSNGTVTMVPGYVQGPSFQSMVNSMGSSW